MSYTSLVAIENVLQQALALDPDQRAELAAALLRSLEPDDGETLTEQEWHAAWSVEIERRLRDLHEGRAKTFSHDEVMARVRERLAKP